MNKANTTADQKEQPTIGLSLKLAVLAGALTTIADAIGTVAALEAIDEFIAADTQAKQDQQELDDKLNEMQRQINILTDELSKIKKGTV